MPEDYVKINIGCGNCFVGSDDWVNLDLNAINDSIQKKTFNSYVKNLSAESVNCIYMSHLIEHLDGDAVIDFFDKAYRVLKPGGGIRIVTPDFDSIVHEYIRATEKGSTEIASFEKLMLLEQCTRTEPSGTYRSEIRRLIDKSDENDIVDHVYKRTGEHPLENSNTKNLKRSKSRNLRAVCSRFFRRLSKRMLRCHLAMVRWLLPQCLRSNLSLTDAGERHLWIYSAYEVEQLARAKGFTAIFNMAHDQSKFLCVDELAILDIADNGSARKGTHSMFLEVVK